jgi:predicted TIM-barrel fold metal-dependent hydrolase
MLKKPQSKLPKGSIDCHAHICGPDHVFPYSSNRIYTPPDALLPDYLALLDTLGVERAVLVQPSIYGTDNRALINSLEQFPTKLRGVAVVDEGISENEIQRLHDVGVRGVRCNIVDLADGKGILPMDNLSLLANKIAPWGWHLELLMHVNEFPDIYSQFKNFPVEIVLGHYGYQPTRLGINTKGFQDYLAMMREGRAWAKFTAPYRISSQDKLPFDDVQIFAETIFKNNPQQIIWGTDWPHVMVKQNMPNDADLCDLVFDWVPDERMFVTYFL